MPTTKEVMWLFANKYGFLVSELGETEILTMILYAILNSTN